MAAPIVYPLIMGATARANENSSLKRRRDEAAQRLLGPLNNMINEMGSSIQKSNNNLRETGENLVAVSEEMPRLIRNTAIFAVEGARRRNFHNFRKLSHTTSELMSRITKNYGRARRRNSENLRRMGSTLGSIARTARNFYIRAARRMG